MPSNDPNALWRRILAWLKGPEATEPKYSYDYLAQVFDTSPRAVGMAMKAIGKHDGPKQCSRVVFKSELY